MVLWPLAAFVVAVMTGQIAVAQDAPPIPVPKPHPEAGGVSTVAPEGRSADDLEYAALPRARGVDPAGVCDGRLAALGVTLEALAPIEDGECGVADPVSVTALANRSIRLSEQAVLTCAMAEKFALWLRDGVDPAARRVLGGRLTGLRLKGSYKCRSFRDDDSRLSQHALGNAVDIVGFEVEGKGWITVGEATGRQQAFLSAARESACDYFTTVLGPGSNALHADHFHVDLAKRWALFRRLYCR